MTRWSGIKRHSAVRYGFEASPEYLSAFGALDANLVSFDVGGVPLTNEARHRLSHAYCHDPLLYSSGKVSAMTKRHDRFSSRRIEGPDQGKNQHVLCRCQSDHSRRDLVTLKEAAS